MRTVHMSFAEGVHTAMHLSRLTKDVCEGLDEYMETMPLPEGADEIKRMTVSMWVHHYINGTCSFDSLLNIAGTMGLRQLFDEPPKELECDAKGEIHVWKDEVEGDCENERF